MYATFSARARTQTAPQLPFDEGGNRLTLGGHPKRRTVACCAVPALARKSMSPPLGRGAVGPLRRLFEVRQNRDLPPLLSERGGTPLSLSPVGGQVQDTLPSSAAAEATSGVRPLSVWPGQTAPRQGLPGPGAQQSAQVQQVSGARGLPGPYPVGECEEVYRVDYISSICNERENGERVSS